MSDATTFALHQAPETNSRGAIKQPKKANEKAMYPHLQKILDDIVDFEHGSYSWRSYIPHNSLAKVEAHLGGFPSLSQDLWCSRQPGRRNQLITWHGMDSFLQVKPSSSQGAIPKSSDTNTILKTLCQTAAYARPRMSSRPFQLFSVAVVGSGSTFAVVIFNRDSIMASTDFDVCHTIANFDVVRILKNAWRRRNHDTESEIYESIPIQPVGVADFREGGDVMAPGPKGVICASSLCVIPSRSFHQSIFIHHRLVLNSTCRALWECNSCLKIIKGVRSALNGHKQLHEQRILRHDVRPGNVLTAAEVSAEPGEEGFLMDFDFARISTIVPQDVQRSSLNDGGSQSDTAPWWRDAQQGAVMTGTIHFMAIQLVEAMVDRRQVKHEVNHDMESVIWVLAYAVARWLINVNSSADPDIKDEISMFFAEAWGGVSLREIHTAKRALNALQPLKLIQPLFPGPILSLFITLGDILLDRMKRGLTHQLLWLDHNELIHALNKCIVGFESPDYDGPK